MKKVAIIGSGVLAQHIAHYLIASGKFAVTGFYDDFRQKGETTSFGLIAGPLNQVEEDFGTCVFDELLIGIGYNHLPFRQEIFEKFYNKIPFATFVHPSCYVDPSCQIGQGVVALPGCYFDMQVRIKDNVFFNMGCVIAHDSTIGSHNFFGPAVKVAGFVQIDSGCFIGIGTTIIDNIGICSGTKTGGGAVITKAITAPGLFIGIPAKIKN